MTEQSRVSELVRLFQQGDRTAFDKLYSLYYNRQYYFVYKLLRDEYAAQDVVQEAFLKLYKNLDTLKEAKAFSVWLNQVTYNSCLNYIRENKHNRADVSSLDDYAETLADHTDQDPYTQVQQREVRRSVLAAVDELSVPMRTVVILKYFNGLKEREIARILDCPVGTVKSRLAAARKKLSLSLKGVSCLVPFFLVGRAVRLDAYAFCGASKTASAAAVYTAAGLTCSVIAAASIAAASGGPAFTSVRLTVPGEFVTSQVVEADMSSALAVKSVRLNGQEIQTMPGERSCRFTVDENGEYILSVTDAAGRESSQRIDVDNIDSQAPGIAEQSIEGDWAVLKAADDRSGIDWQRSCQVGEDGRSRPVEHTETSAESGDSLIRIRLGEGAVCLILVDRAGNSSVYRLDIGQEKGENLER